MKKVIKITLFSLIFMLGFIFNAKAKALTPVNFCGTDQEYFFDDNCRIIDIQCTYKDKNDNVLYVNISKSADVQIGKEGEKGKPSVANWGVDDKVYKDAKEIYQKDRKCFGLVIEKGNKYYLVNYGGNSGNQNVTSKNVTKYDLESGSINTYGVETDGGETDGETIPNPYESYPEASNCSEFNDPNDCKTGINKYGSKFGCAWNEEYEFCSPSGLAYLSCGSGNSKAYDIPPILPKLSSYAVVALKTATPIILIIMGMIQLIKAIASQKEDEMKKARGSLIKKLIASVLIFFTVSIVQFVVTIAADSSETGSLENCLKCFLNNDCDEALYFTDGYGNCYDVKKEYGTHKKLEGCPVDNY